MRQRLTVLYYYRHDLVAHKPGVVPGIRKALNEDSKIADKALKDQFEKLILQPLLGVKQAGS